jgi:hypothetical protein
VEEKQEQAVVPELEAPIARKTSFGSLHSHCMNLFEKKLYRAAASRIKFIPFRIRFLRISAAEQTVCGEGAVSSEVRDSIMENFPITCSRIPEQ